MNEHIIDFGISHAALILAAKGSGKSTLIAEFLLNEELYKNKYAKVFIFSPTFRGDPAYSAVELPPEQVFSTVEDSDLETIIGLKMSDEYVDENFLIIFDDIVSDRNIRKSRVLKQLLLNSRHYGNTDDNGIQKGFTLLYSTQHLTSLPTYIRQNLNLIIAFRTNNHSAIEILWKEYGASLSREQFLKIFRYCTQVKYNFLMTDGIEYYRNFSKLSVNFKEK